MFLFNTGLKKTLEFPTLVHNVPCLHEESQAGVNITIHAQTVGFVSLHITDAQTEELYLEYSVGITRPPERIVDKVGSYKIHKTYFNIGWEIIPQTDITGIQNLLDWSLKKQVIHKHWLCF